MTREERRALLGPETLADIHAQVAAAPEPPAEVVEELRRLLAWSVDPEPEIWPAADAA